MDHKKLEIKLDEIKRSAMFFIRCYNYNKAATMAAFVAGTTILPWVAGRLVEDLMQMVILWQDLVVIFSDADVPQRVTLPWIAHSLVVHPVDSVDTDMPQHEKLANSLVEELI